MRHLHWCAWADMDSACGEPRLRSKEVEGGGFIFEQLLPTVHFSKARRTDCPECRRAVRKEITAGRRAKDGRCL